MEDEKGYEVVDKRKNASHEQSEPEQASAEPQGEEEQVSGELSGDVYSLIGLTVMMLAESAWQWMGLRVNPGLGRVEKDMIQAKIAIDSIVFLSDKIAPHVGEADKKAMREMISNLQINFVQQSSQG